MQEKDLKPSGKQRLIFALVAFVLLGSSIAAYVLIIMGNGTVNYTKMTMEQLNTAYTEKMEELNAEAASLSSQYFDEFKTYKKEVKAFNSANANSSGVQSKDLKEGDGDALGTSGYSAYYIGWCSDESIFDSSFDNFEEPTALNAPLVIQANSLIEGWYLGTEGMKLGGVREITIPGSLAYGESYEICGGTNSPLKFIIMAIETNEKIKKLNDELNQIYTAMSNLYAKSYSSSDASDYSTEATTSGE